MNINERYPKLYGHSLIGNRTLHNTQEVAEFICYAGEYGDVTITDKNGVLILSTFGIYIDKAVDLEYRDELLKVIVPMQKEIAGDEVCLNGGSDEFIKSLEEKVKEYIVSDAYKQDFEELKRAYTRSKIEKSDNEIMQEATGRFRTQCIKEAQADMFEKLSIEAEEYLHTDQFQLDMMDKKYQLEREGLEIPSESSLTDRLKEIFIEQRRREIFCEENGHSWQETNPDPENGTSELDCERCGEHHTLHW